MTREELRGHCERQIQQFERVEKIMPVTPNDWKRYEEHKLILELLEQEPRWIPVGERLPELMENVLIFTKDKEYHVAYRRHKLWGKDEDEWYVFGMLGVALAYDEEEVIAWMPLPESYKVESEE